MKLESIERTKLPTGPQQSRLPAVFLSEPRSISGESRLRPAASKRSSPATHQHSLRLVEPASTRRRADSADEEPGRGRRRGLLWALLSNDPDLRDASPSEANPADARLLGSGLLSSGLRDRSVTSFGRHGSRMQNLEWDLTGRPFAVDTVFIAAVLSTAALLWFSNQ